VVRARGAVRFASRALGVAEDKGSSAPPLGGGVRGAVLVKMSKSGGPRGRRLQCRNARAGKRLV